MVNAKTLLQQALKTIAKPPQNRTIHLALSGGIDSSVCGLILQEAGWDVRPILMRCWDERIDKADTSACFPEELKAANAAAKALQLPSPEVFDFVNEYWTDVFDGVFLKGIKYGYTSNADLACNRHIKFGAFPERLRERQGITDLKETPRFATGHYARLKDMQDGVRLLSGVDEKKDQSYFLAGVKGAELEAAVFPIGGLLKRDVKEIAAWAALPAVGLKSSRGMCFVGKRRFGDFIGQYVQGKKGSFIDIDSGKCIGQMEEPSYAWTIGQRARLGGLAEAMFVVEKRGMDIFVAREGHERLWSKGVFCETVEWICGRPHGLENGLHVQFKACSTTKRSEGLVREVAGGVEVKFENRARRVAEGQAVVLYDGEVCLGAAWPIERGHAYQQWLTSSQLNKVI